MYGLPSIKRRIRSSVTRKPSHYLPHQKKKTADARFRSRGVGLATIVTIQVASDAKHHYCRICQCLLYNIERDQKWPDMDFDNMSVSTTQPNVQDDDDLDDLDDVLSQFTPGQNSTYTSQPDTSSQTSLSSPLSPPPPPPPTASTETTFRRPRNNTRVDAIPTFVLGSTNLDTAAEAAEEELDFLRELAKGMENLMRELSAEDSTRSTDNDGSSEESARALKAAWEQMLVEGMDGDPGVGQDSGFQDKIKQAMNKLKESESSLQADGKPANVAPNAESLEALLGSLGEGGDEKELAGLLENLMGELMSKSILYEPLSELAQNFPPYLEKPPSPLSDEDRKRYDLQVDCIRRVLAVFDDAGYDDKDAECQQKIGDLMAEMQNYGPPPPELMGPLPDVYEEGCTIT